MRISTNNVSFDDKLVMELIDQAFGNGSWETVSYRNEETNRQLVWQKKLDADTVRVMSHKHGVLIESHTIPNTHNYCESQEDLVEWIKNYTTNSLDK